MHTHNPKRADRAAESADMVLGGLSDMSDEDKLRKLHKSREMLSKRLEPYMVLRKTRASGKFFCKTYAIQAAWKARKSAVKHGNRALLTPSVMGFLMLDQIEKTIERLNGREQ